MPLHEEAPSDPPEMGGLIHLPSQRPLMWYLCADYPTPQLVEVLSSFPIAWNPSK